MSVFSARGIVCRVLKLTSCQSSVAGMSMLKLIIGNSICGLEVAVEPWMDGLFPALQEFFNIGTSSSPVMTAEQNINLCQNENGHVKQENCRTESQETCTLKTGNIDLEQMNQTALLKEPEDNGHVKSIETNDSTENDNRINSCDSLSNGINLSSSLISNVSSLSKNDSDNFKSTGNTLTKSKENSSVNESSSSNQNGVSRSSTISVCQPSLTVSTPPLSESSISVPVLPAEYLRIDYQENQSVNLCDIPLQNGCPFPSAASSVTMATIMSATVLTREDSLKKTLCLKLDTKKSLDYMPGDSISVIVKNEDNEVIELLDRLGVIDQCDKTCCISVMEGTKKRNPNVPPHIPPLCTLRHIFTTCIDIRDPPKKALLRVLIEHTTDQSEKRRLQELCSKQGAADYTQFLRQPSLSVSDILEAFPSCNPPVERLLEHLPRLQPRPYSVCSSPIVNPGTVEIAFNIIDIPLGNGRSCRRTGVCTGMLDNLTRSIQSKAILMEGSVESLSNTIQNLEITSPTLEIPIYNRTNQHFRMSDDLNIPIIMIGPGTGVAPFVGFLRHREALKKDMSDPEQYGDTWLFYGCRHQDRDYIYRKELEALQRNDILTKLCVCFSRDDQLEESPRYVQDNIRKYFSELSTLIMEKNASIFVCGDAENMAKDVNQAIMFVIQSYKGCSEDEARADVMKMRLHKRYLEDVWT